MRIPSICCAALLTVTGMAGAATLNNADKQFLVTVARTDMTEAHEGQMAEDQASRPDVKDFGKTLVQDHTQSYEQLTQLAAKTGVSIPKGIDTAKDANLQHLAHLKGSHFDTAFDTEEIASHRRAIALFKREATSAKDPDVKAFASNMIPVLEKHLQLAEQCAKENTNHPSK